MFYMCLIFLILGCLYAIQAVQKFEDFKQVYIADSASESEVSSFQPYNRSAIKGKTPRTLCFHDNIAGERGTAIAMYDYADYAEQLWGVQSIVYFPYTYKPGIHHSRKVLKKYQDRFRIILYPSFQDLLKSLLIEKCDFLYVLISGEKTSLPTLESLSPEVVPIGFHAVFVWEPHGSAYAAISEDVSQHKADRTVVPHMVRPVNMTEYLQIQGLRKELNISSETLVLCRHGGLESFDISFVQKAVWASVDKYPAEKLQYVFLNTMPFTRHGKSSSMPIETHPSIHHLPKIVDLKEKERFFRTCDGMLHARMMGETFGLAVAEFSVRNLPVLTYRRFGSGFHREILGNKAFLYDERSLSPLIDRLVHEKFPKQDYNAYAQFAPEKVMPLFKRGFLDPIFGSSDSTMGSSFVAKKDEEEKEDHYSLKEKKRRERKTTEWFPNHKHSMIRIQVFHFILPHWGKIQSGDFTCEKNVQCDWIASDSHLQLQSHLVNDQHHPHHHHHSRSPVVTVGLYNIHSLWEKFRVLKPLLCYYSTNISMYETEEARVRYLSVFDTAPAYFDAYSSTNPHSDVQRVYTEAFLNQSEFLTLQPFSSLIKGGSYVASNCHLDDNADAHRDEVVVQLRALGVRIDGLGNCLRTETIPEGIHLPYFEGQTKYNLLLKRQVLGRYAFHMALENSLEEGYVTEKVFDALVAGSVPVYLGDGKHLKSLLPDPLAVIFVQDFENLSFLAQYLQSLLSNETAYERHREWRQSFSSEGYRRGKPLLEKSWQCRICHWAAHQYELSRVRGSQAIGIEPQQSQQQQQQLLANNASSRGIVTHKIRNRVCEDSKKKLSKEEEGRLYRPKNQRGIYLVREGVLHLVPDFATFVAMGFDLSQVKVIAPKEFEEMLVGEDLPSKAS